MSRRQVDRLIGAALVTENLGPIGPKPDAESQVRPLSQLPPEQQREAWAEAVETAPNGRPTAKVVATAAANVAAKHRPEPLPPPPRREPVIPPETYEDHVAQRQLESRPPDGDDDGFDQDDDEDADDDQDGLVESDLVTVACHQPDTPVIHVSVVQRSAEPRPMSFVTVVERPATDAQSAPKEERKDPLEIVLDGLLRAVASFDAPKGPNAGGWGGFREVIGARSSRSRRHAYSRLEHIAERLQEYMEIIISFEGPIT